jgi:hypothetical protein
MFVRGLLRRTRALLTPLGRPLSSGEESLCLVRSQEFYDREAVDRRYFFWVDSQGRLFLESVVPKNITSCLKDRRMLDFFFSRVRPNATGLFPGEYRFVSPCGKEMNYIGCSDTPIVFSGWGEGRRSLLYGASLSQPFEPHDLRVSREGRLFHRLDHRHMPKDSFCLVKSSIVLELSQAMVLNDSSEDHAGVLNWQGGSISIPWL